MTDFADKIEAGLVERGYELIGSGDDFDWYRSADGSRSVFVYDAQPQRGGDSLGRFEVFEADEPADGQAPDYTGHSLADLGRVDATALICGHWFRPLTERDRDGFAGASETCLICDWASGGSVLLYEVGQRTIIEVGEDNEVRWMRAD